LETIREYTEQLGLALGVRGLLNVQYAIKDDIVYILEANPRASRTVPFIAKAHQVPYVNIATKVMLGANKLKDFKVEPKLEGYAIKLPVFSFDKFPNVNKELGPEMKSTGEAIQFIEDLHDENFLKLYAERNLYLSR
jgi:carbamoyl-phosphate synthase large subunit